MSVIDFNIALFANIKDVRKLGEINHDTIKKIFKKDDLKKGIRLVFNNNQIRNKKPTLELISINNRLLCEINTKGEIVLIIRDTLVSNLEF